jgi:hypothetical protein
LFLFLGLQYHHEALQMVEMVLKFFHLHPALPLFAADSFWLFQFIFFSLKAFPWQPWSTCSLRVR